MSPGGTQLFDISEMTCLSCTHSCAKWNDDQLELTCRKTDEPCDDVCGSFVYEPGSDESEHHASE